MSRGRGTVDASPSIRQPCQYVAPVAGYPRSDTVASVSDPDKDQETCRAPQGGAIKFMALSSGPKKYRKRASEKTPRHRVGGFGDHNASSRQPHRAGPGRNPRPQ